MRLALRRRRFAKFDLDPADLLFWTDELAIQWGDNLDMLWS